MQNRIHGRPLDLKCDSQGVGRADATEDGLLDSAAFHQAVHDVAAGAYPLEEFVGTGNRVAGENEWVYQLPPGTYEKSKAQFPKEIRT